MRRVFIATPYAEADGFRYDGSDGRAVGEAPLTWLDRPNVLFAQACCADAIRRGEAPFASHLLYTQPGILRDEVPEERAAGMAAGTAFLPVCEALIVYIDRGVSRGMKLEIQAARRAAMEIIVRRLDGQTVTVDMAREIFG